MDPMFTGIHRPPRGTKLFGYSESHWRLNACMDRGLIGSAEWYAIGYQSLAERVGAALVRNEGLHDAEVCALAFLWRHCLELHLKILVRNARREKGETDLTLGRHALTPLWEEAKAEFPQFNIVMDEDLKEVERFIREFDAVDPDSMQFRYPADKTHTKPHLANKNVPEHINVKVLCDVMAWTNNILGALGDAMTAGEGEGHVRPASK